MSPEDFANIHALLRKARPSARIAGPNFVCSAAELLAVFDELVDARQQITKAEEKPQ